MIVVSNTSPLINLAAIGQFELLHQRLHRVHLLNASRSRRSERLVFHYAEGITIVLAIAPAVRTAVSG